MRRNSIGLSAVLWAASAALVMSLLLYVPAPYLVFEPGFTRAADPYIESAAEPEQRLDGGEWMIATVYMSRGSNYWAAIQSLWRTDREAYSRKQVLGGGTVQQYAERMRILMDESQSSAIEAAYKAAGIGYEIVPRSLVVTKPGGSGRFMAGDRILKADGREVASGEQLLEAAGGAQAVVRMTIERDGQQLEIELKGGALEQGTKEPEEPEERRLLKLLGIEELTEVRSIQPIQPEHEMRVTAEEVGGPSAGLIFALDMYDRLTSGDLAAGRRIAGTGAIDASGRVREVGGVGLKVIAADRAGAAMFLVPKGNYKEAADKAKAINSRMRIIAVESLDDAIRELTIAGG